ncbi:MAG: flippase-like domain-containing protein, partial [Candidatus Aminicenantales bacterium]
MKIGYNVKDRANSRRIVRIVGTALILGLAVGVFISLFLDRQVVLRTLAKVKLIYLLIPLLMFVAAHFIDTARLTLVLAQFKIRIHFAQAFYNSAVGPFFTNITPMSAGGQPFQIYHLCAINVKKDTATNVILTRFVEQLLISMMLLLIFLPQMFIVTSSLKVSRPLAYLALGITVFLSLFLLSLLVWPSTFGRFALRLEHTRFGLLVGRLTKRHDWCEAVHRESHLLQASVRFLWREKIPIMIADTSLGLVNMGLHAWSLYFVLEGVVGVKVE